MIYFGRRSTSEHSREERSYPDGGVRKKSYWMLTGQDPRFSPTVYLYEQPAGTTLPPHFHHNNQFQVFIEGAGKIGARKLRPVTVHYAGAYTGYGPLVAGPEGLKYFVFRTAYESGGVMISQAMSNLPEGPRRHATSKPFDASSIPALRSLAEPVETSVLPAADDSLAVTSIELPPDRRLPPVRIGDADGIFLFVLSGLLVGPSDELMTWESLFATPDVALPELRAGADGAHVLLMVSPRRDPAYA